MSKEKLGTCSHATRPLPGKHRGLHKKSSTCTNWREQPAQGEPSAPAGGARERTPLEEALHRREADGDVSTAREFYIASNKGILPSQVTWSADGAMRFAEAYAAKRVRQQPNHLTAAMNEKISKLEVEVAQLQQERDADRLAEQIYALAEKVVISEEPLHFVRKVPTPQQIAAVIRGEVKDGKS